MEIRIEKRTDIIIKLRFEMKKSVPHAYCNLLALGVLLRLFPRHGIPAAMRSCWLLF